MTKSTPSFIQPVNIVRPPSSASPYYTEVNAYMIKPLIDDLISNPRDVFFSASMAGCSAKTLYQKFVYGIKWLVEKDKDAAKYSEFRSKVKIGQALEGVNVKFIKMFTLAATGTYEIAKPQVSWLATFQDWLEKAQQFEVFDSAKVFGGALPLTDEDERAMIKICAPLGCELSFHKESGSFTVMR